MVCQPANKCSGHLLIIQNIDPSGELQVRIQYVEFLYNLLKREIELRDRAHIDSLVKDAKFPVEYSFEQFRTDEVEFPDECSLETLRSLTALRFDIDMDKFQLITRRRAGRKRKKSGILYEQVLEYRKTHTAIETAEWLGLTRQTFYRKLKVYKKEY